MTETEEVARAIYEGRNGRGCTPWARLPAEHKAPYLADAMAAMRVILERQYPGRGGQWLDETQKDGPTMNNEWRLFHGSYANYGLDRRNPYDHALVDIRRGEDGDISTVDPRKLSPTLNVVDLYWRPYRQAVRAEDPQWSPAEIARYRAENSPPLTPNRLGKHADAK